MPQVNENTEVPEVVYTRTEVEEGLRNDLSLSFNFAIDNNYPALVEALNQEGFTPNDDVDALANLTFLYEFDKAKFERVLSNVPYNNQAGNWTEGFDEVFRPENTRPPDETVNPMGGNRSTNRTTSVWGSIFAGIAAFGSTFFNASNQMTPEQAAAAAVIAAEEKKRKDRNTMIIILVVIAAVIGFAIYSKSKKKEK